MTENVFNFLKEARNKLGVETLVETGTYLAESTLRFAAIFPKVYSIELSQGYFERAVKMYEDVSNITFIAGASPVVISELIEESKGPMAFYLDAHWSGGSTEGKDNQCPLMEELSSLLHYQDEKIIIIDDARLFLTPVSEELNKDHWPDITDILAFINHEEPYYTALYDWDLLCVPRKHKPFLVDFIRKTPGNGYPR